MSSSHLLVVARNHRTGEIQLPLEDLTLYGVEPVKDDELVRGIAEQYDEDWAVTLYGQVGPNYSGSKS